MNLDEVIKNSIIQNQAPIGFDEFMQLALYYPKLGYYRSGSEKFGEKGDFVTAPETSDLFGFCLAKQCAQVLKKTDDILEFGAGSGVLAAQILFELGRLDCLPKHYYILELSAELRHRQKQTIAKALPELLECVIWLDQLPQAFNGVVIANEVLDAMPAKRIIQKDKIFYELGVGIDQDTFNWQVKDQIIQKDTFKFPPLMSEGYTTEINQQAIAWIDSLYGALDNALILLIDYGMHRDEYFHPQRIDGTLRCYHQHKSSEDPFVNIGEQDITTSVNFSDIADQARLSGFKVSGYATQALFLISLGIDEYLLNETDDNKRISLAQQVKQLVLPSAMGESFKVLALSKNRHVKLIGFKEQDLSHKL
ncbi:SAM-dependent methyltransferase [Candidatus Thioglobus sp.]|jgi:SAM-dependent MidA family methyltransferase|uniref:class I SAM-dependent methyltransferase n=1 Tax=Candidatus Thioglobus sp. TaxID=2026721 RepID=UPI001775E49B|nr:SAM-dependent methyltransferase [Candidatus Thioglobus sp.]HIF47065.1 SAM-dependent methyltransferase [Candidatus Thioglobus sp.]